MSYLLDTNVISEVTKPNPNLKVVQWLREIPNNSLYISVLTMGEIRKGIEMLISSAKKEKLLLFLETEVQNWFEDRIISVDLKVSDKWGRLSAAEKSSVSAIDCLIAATVIAYDLRLVTRNVQNFKTFPVDLINPWEKI